MYKILTEVGVEQSDTVDENIEVRTSSELGLVEVTVLDNLSILLVCGIGVNVSQVRIQLLALNGKGVGIENVDLAALKLSSNLLQLSKSAFCSSVLVNTGQNYRTLLCTAAPVGSDG